MDILNLQGEIHREQGDYFAAQDKEYPGARWGLNYDRFLFGNLAQFFHRHELNVGLEDTEDLLISSDTGLRFPLKNHFDATLQYTFDWDNTPAQGKKREDQGYMLKFGYRW